MIVEGLLVEGHISNSSDFRSSRDPNPEDFGVIARAQINPLVLFDSRAGSVTRKILPYSTIQACTAPAEKPDSRHQSSVEGSIILTQEENVVVERCPQPALMVWEGGRGTGPVSSIS